MRALVVANGEPPSGDLLHRLAETADLIVAADGGAIIALEPDLARDLVAAVRAHMGERGVLLASSDIRRHLKTVLDPELPDVAVVAPHELTAGITVAPQGRIDVG